MEMKNKYLIVDSRGAAVAHCTLLNGTEESGLMLKVDEADLKRVLRHEYITLLCAVGDAPAIGARIVRRAEDRIWVEKAGEVGGSVRKNLRMPVHFESFLYPITGTWRGRALIIANDLSCGGLSFFCQRTLKPKELVEIVIPVTVQPIILRAKILRQRPAIDSIPMYAAQFYDLLREEETMVQEAVFTIQIQDAPSR